MALAPLAQAADLDTKGVDISNAPLVALMLDVASSVIREAAGSTISQETSTVKVMAPDGRWLTLPGPVTAVASVLLDGVAFADWKFIGGMLWHPWGWSYGTYTYQRPFRHDIWIPVEVTVTYTHGYVEVPADIVNLCADLAKLGIESASQQSRPAALLSSTESIDDRSETFQYAANAGTLMELPEATQQWLAQRFGAGVYVTSELK